MSGEGEGVPYHPLDRSPFSRDHVAIDCPWIQVLLRGLPLAVSGSDPGLRPVRRSRTGVPDPPPRGRGKVRRREGVPFDI